MSALRQLKSWWITEDPDDVARERAHRDVAIRRLERVKLVAMRLRSRLADVSRRCEEAERRADHYRSGWLAGEPFVDGRACGRAKPDRMRLPRAS